MRYSSEKVRAAANHRGCNEVDQVDRPQPGGAGCGHLLLADLRRRWCLAVNKSPANSPPWSGSRT